jgi:hypothetical protein
MPTIAVILGMAIVFYYDDHEPPHFHVRAPGFKARINLADLSASEVNGRMRPQDLARLRAWAGRHRPELYENWTRARRRQPLVPIEG